MNWEWEPSLFDHLTDPYRAGDTPLAEYTDLQLAQLIIEWKKVT